MSTFSDSVQETISPHDQRPVPGTRKIYLTENEIDQLIHKANEAQAKWRRISVVDRINIGRRFVVFINLTDRVAR
jgi:acyl-CoA reductase-like NAD-dependent aldehyde dehydrogenase